MSEKAPGQQQMSPETGNISVSQNGLFMNYDGKLHYLDPIPNVSLKDLLCLYFCGMSKVVYTPIDLANGASKEAKSERKAAQLTYSKGKPLKYGAPCCCVSHCFAPCPMLELAQGGENVATVVAPACLLGQDYEGSRGNFCLSCCPGICCTHDLCCTKNFDHHLKHLTVIGKNEDPEADEKKGKKLVPKFMILQRMVACWLCAGDLRIRCMPCAALVEMVYDVFALCEGKVAKQISQPVYRAIKNKDEKPEKVGDIKLTNFAICSFRNTYQTEFKPVEGFVPTKAELDAIGALLHMYEGHGMVDCVLGGLRGMGYPKPTGVPCFDLGLEGTVQRISIGELVGLTKASLGVSETKSARDVEISDVPPADTGPVLPGTPVNV